MDRVAWSVCSAFLNTQGAPTKDKLIRFLPENEQKALKSLPSTEKNPLSASFDEADFISSVHHSWLMPLMREATELEVSLYLAALEAPLASKIQKELLFSKAVPQLTAVAKDFITHIAYSHLTQDQENFLPKEMLPHSPLTSLLDLTVDQLRAVIEYLGLHDLSVDMKQIIDNTKLKKIYAALTKESSTYLSHISSKKEPVIFKKIELQRWDGKSDSLKKLVTHRGINRLAKALYPENESLKWHITRKVSVEDAQLLMSLCKPLEHAKATTLLVHQILEVMPLTQKQNSRKTV